MRAFVILLLLLAAAKLGFQEYLFRTATRDALLEAYRQHAVEACQRDARSQSLGVAPQAWANPRDVQLVIGRHALDVYPWQVDHPNWNARYRNPYLLLMVGPRTGTALCEYDILNAAASVSRM
jgi:hypothetical protein